MQLPLSPVQPLQRQLGLWNELISLSRSLTEQTGSMPEQSSLLPCTPTPARPHQTSSGLSVPLQRFASLLHALHYASKRRCAYWCAPELYYTAYCLGYQLSTHSS